MFPGSARVSHVGDGETPSRTFSYAPRGSQELAHVIAQLGERGAGRRAAEAVAKLLTNTTDP
jgi:hypothetical protein